MQSRSDVEDDRAVVSVKASEGQRQAVALALYLELAHVQVEAVEQLGQIGGVFDGLDVEAGGEQRGANLPVVRAEKTTDMAGLH